MKASRVTQCFTSSSFYFILIVASFKKPINICSFLHTKQKHSHKITACKPRSPFAAPPPQLQYTLCLHTVLYYNIAESFTRDSSCPKTQNNLNSFLSDTNNRLHLIRNNSATTSTDLCHIQSTLFSLATPTHLHPSSNMNTTTCMTPIPHFSKPSFPTTVLHETRLLYSSTAQTASLSVIRAYAKKHYE